MLGLCFIVITSLKVNHKTAGTVIDEVSAVAIVLFMASSLLSFLSMRSTKASFARYEKMADILFLVGLSLLFVVTLLIVFDIVK